MTELVTVIVPLYNGEKHIGDALRSIQEQDYEPMEIVVVDNGSSDGGVAIARTHPVRMVEETRQGAGAARNTGVDRARGDILMFLDQDDLWLPGKVRRQVEQLAARPDGISLVHQRLRLDNLESAPAWLKPHLLETPHTGWAPSCLAVRRETFERIGRFDDSFLHGSDLDWFGRCTSAGVGASVIEDVLVIRRVHAASSSGSRAAFDEMFSVVRGAALRNRKAKEPNGQ